MSEEMAQTVSAIVRRDQAILLVRQDAGGGSGWFLPGGNVEPGEPIPDAVSREVVEETGLLLVSERRLAYVTAISVAEPVGPASGMAVVFECVATNGEPCPDDPDGAIMEAAFWPIPLALEQLAAWPFARMRDPVLRYLAGDIAPGSLFVYQTGFGAEDDLLLNVVEPAGAK